MDVRCANCSAKIPLERDDALITCPFCNSTLYLDRAHSFLTFEFAPAITQQRACDLLAQELAAREIPRQPVVATKGLLLPFWGVRGEALQETLPAFSPVPSALSSFRLPSAGATVYRQEAPDGFSAVPCAEGASAAWEGREDISFFRQMMVPFFRVTYGVGGSTYTAWVDAVSGKVYGDQTPPPMTAAISRQFWGVLAVLFVVFALEGMLIPGFLPSALVIALTGVACVPLVRGAMGGGSP